MPQLSAAGRGCPGTRLRPFFWVALLLAGVGLAVALGSDATAAGDSAVVEVRGAPADLARVLGGTEPAVRIRLVGKGYALVEVAAADAPRILGQLPSSRVLG